MRINSSEWPTRIAAAVTRLLGIVYVLQAATPLRLDDDAVDYLWMGAAIADGRPVPPVPLPTGFPYIIAFLDRAGLGSSFWFVLANCLFLGLGVFSAWKILSDRSPLVRWCAIGLTLLAIPTVKSIPIALPEATFFGLSLLALWAMSTGRTATGERRALLFGAALVVAATATSVRLIGVTLVPALIWCALTTDEKNEHESGAKTWRIAVLAVICLLAVGLLVAIAKANTFSVYSVWTRTYYSQGTLFGQIAKRAYSIARGWGEIVVNLPFSRLRSSGGFFAAAGMVSAVAIVWLMRKSRGLTPSRIYMLVYLIAVAVWPNPSPRLWMPILPLIVGEVAPAIGWLPRARWTTGVVGAYCAWILLTGVAALAYTTRISLSGANFPSVYGRNGGMAIPGDSTRDSRWLHGRIYNEEAKQLLIRYGR